MAVSGLCRLCGCGGAAMDAGPLRDIVLKYIGIPIEITDTLPKRICERCVCRIQSFDEFANECLRMQDRFADMPPEELENAEHVKVEIEFAELSFDFKEETSNGDETLKEEHFEEVGGFDFDPDDQDYVQEEEDEDFIPKQKKKKSSSHISRKSDCNLKEFIDFTCCACSESFSNWYRLKAHVIAAHQLTAYVRCRACGCEVRSKTAIYRHVAAHNNTTDPLRYACDRCPRQTKSLEALAAHKARHDANAKDAPPRSYACSSCAKLFTTKEGLRSHERVHIPLAERYHYPCGVCGNRFTTKSAVAGHVRAVHDKIKRYVCDVCGYACSTSGELVQHRAIHSDFKGFQCRICSKRFKTGSNLKAHIDTHAETSYPCGVCGKVLNSRRTLRKHFLVHDDLCRHVCTFCNKAFKRRQTLKVHLTTHTGDKPIKCNWCPAKFAFSSALRNHKLKLHQDKMLEVKEEEMRDVKMEQLHPHPEVLLSYKTIESTDKDIVA